MPVLWEVQRHVVVITIDRPEALNAIDPETNEQLIESWRRYRDDPELRVAVVTGTGDRSFSAGVDLKRMG
ncbi:MAG: enoyl-CoA hydratase-related protein, partial [Thermoplasmata archaeon]|nr:enoyl-CoA hydratase-related protein [Thermoplasmata archaeon]